MNPATQTETEAVAIALSTERGLVEDPPTLLHWLSLVLSHRRAILYTALAGALVGGAFKLLQPRAFTAKALAIMDSQTSASALSGLTASLGLPTLQGDGSPSPYFYADLVTSDLVLGSAVDSVYTYRTGKRVVKGNLVSIFDVSGGTPAQKRERAIIRLRKMVSARVTAKTGVITVAAKTRDPGLAPLIVARVISEVNRANILSRQNQAGGEREFTGRRVAEAAQELRTAENQLQYFLQTNRDYQAAPQTAFEEDRLARTVAMRQAIFTSVSQAYEQARIQEARDTPGLRVVEPPTVPVYPDPRGLTEFIILGLFLGGATAICWGLWNDYLADTAQRDPDQVRQFRKAVGDLIRDITHPWRFWHRA
jgi:uncharacterized protein involved in exopolysaccharide biosynthesis